MCPLYDACCDDCGESFEYVRAMKDSASVPRCPACKSHNTAKTIVEAPIMKMRDAGWQHENGGKGRRFPQLAKHALDESQDCHFRSVGEAREAAKKRGFIVSDE
jgi:putative FmdB family regulatory protein